MSVSQDAPNPMARHIETVRQTRAYLARAEQMKFDMAPSIVMLRDLLAAYDHLAARVAGIVANRAEPS